MEEKEVFKESVCWEMFRNVMLDVDGLLEVVYCFFNLFYNFN